MMDNDDYIDTNNLKKQIVYQPIIKLPTNHIPKGLIPLENIFFITMMFQLNHNYLKHMQNWKITIWVQN